MDRECHTVLNVTLGTIVKTMCVEVYTLHEAKTYELHVAERF